MGLDRVDCEWRGLGRGGQSVVDRCSSRGTDLPVDWDPCGASLGSDLSGSLQDWDPCAWQMDLDPCAPAWPPLTDSGHDDCEPDHCRCGLGPVIKLPAHTIGARVTVTGSHTSSSWYSAALRLSEIVRASSRFRASTSTCVANRSTNRPSSVSQQAHEPGMHGDRLWRCAWIRPSRPCEPESSLANQRAPSVSATTRATGVTW